MIVKSSKFLHIQHKILVLILGFFIAFLSIQVFSAKTSPTDIDINYPAIENIKVQKFIKKMVQKHKFNQADLQQLFAQVTFTKWSQKKISSKKRKPKKPLSWQQYRQLFLTKNRINKGIKFWQEHQEILARAQEKYHIPIEIIVATLGIETNYGTHQGKYKTLDILTKKSFNGYRRAKFYQKELESFLLLTRDNGLSPLSIFGSHAGAMGYAQFIASSYRYYARDFDGDNKVDLFHSPADAIASIANYFAKHRWQKNGIIAYQVNPDDALKPLATQRPTKPRIKINLWRNKGLDLPDDLDNNKLAAMIVLDKDSPKQTQYWLAYANFYAITRYNHRNYYAMAVYQLSKKILEGLEGRK